MTTATKRTVRMIAPLFSTARAMSIACAPCAHRGAHLIVRHEGLRCSHTSSSRVFTLVCSSGQPEAYATDPARTPRAGAPLRSLQSLRTREENT